MEKIKTINFRFLFWFGIVFAIGAVAVSLMSRSIICDDLLMPWPLYLGVSLFGLVALAGIAGVIVLLRKYLILKSVIKYGTETIGEFAGIGGYVEWAWGSAHRRSMPGKYYARIIFTYTVDDEECEYKSCAVYLDKEVKRLQELKTFQIKYKGKHAVICEIV